MIRVSVAVLAALALAHPALSTCEMQAWNQKWFDADAIHYTAADLDGDNVPEIVSASGTTVSYRRPPGFAPFNVYTSTAIGAPVAGDVTGDGDVDLVIPNDGSDSLVVLPGNGDGTFDAPIITALTVSPASFVLGNFSGNAQLDVALIGSSPSSPLIFLQGNGTGAFTPTGTVTVASSPLHLVSRNFDGDGYADVAVSHAGSSTVEVVFANGSGGSAATVSLDGGDSALLAAGDFDGDGDDDLYSIRPLDDRFVLFSNSGARAFAVAVSRDLWSMSDEPVRSIALADLDGDLDLDAALARPDRIDWMMCTNADCSVSSFDQLYPWEQKNKGRSIAVGDFSGDGYIDLAVENADAGHGGLLINQCGPISTHVGLQHKITLGQATQANVMIWAPHAPAPTGTARLTWNGGEKTVTLLTSPNQRLGYRFFTIEGLPLGFQAVVAEYSGDANYPATESTTYITVTTETTTTTLAGPSEWTYGERKDFTATVTSSTGDTPTGYINFKLDGVVKGDEAMAPIGEWRSPADLPAGEHTLSAEVGYSETHPPSSDSMAVTIHKLTPELLFRIGKISRSGQTAWIQALVHPPFPVPVQGMVRLMEGETTLDVDWIGSIGGFTADFTVQGLSLGEHTLQIVYEGDANVEGASLEFVHTVLPAGTALPLIATGSTGFVELEFLPPPAPYGTVYVYRRTASSSWVELGWASGFFRDSNVAAGTTYQYRLQSTSNGVPVHSNVETVYVGPFTDPNLPGAVIRKVHFTELQTALNGFRTMAGLSPLQIDFTGFILASHITQMRNAINDARSALAMPVVAFGAAPVAGVTPIRALDLAQLRDALR